MKPPAKSLGAGRRRLAGAVAAVLLSACTSGVTAQGVGTTRLYEEALRHFNEDRVEDAVVALKEALEEDPGLLPAHVLMARVYLRIAEPAAAQESLLRARRMGADPNITWPLQAQALFLLREYRKLLALTPRDGLQPGPQSEVLVYRGRAHLELSEFSEATEAFRLASDLAPGAPLPFVSMAVTALRQGDVRAARERALEATRVAPDDADAWSALGDVAHVRGRLDEALDAYGRALDRSPRHFEALLARAGIYLDIGRLDDAARDIASLRARAPLAPRPAFLEAVLLGKQGRTAESREALRRASALLDELGPLAAERSAQLLLMAGLANYELGELEQAQGQLAAYVERFPALAGPRKLLGAILLRNDRSAEAVSVLEPALDRAPNDFRLLGLLGKAYMQRGRYDVATGYLGRAVELSGGEAELRADLALSRMGEGFEQEGLAALAAVFEEDPAARGRIGVMLASLQLKRGDAAAAVVTARRLRESWPEDPTVLNMLGSAELSAGRVDDARATFREALARAPSFMPARLNLGILEARRGDTAEARRIFTAILEAQPDNTRAMVELAGIDARAGRRGDAMRWLQKARGADPGSLEASFALVDLHLEAGDPAAAMAIVRESENLAPESMDVLAAMARVHAAQGRGDLALGVLKRMSLLAGFDSDKLLRIATLQSDLGAEEEAMFSLHKAVQNEPGDVDIRLMLARLQTRSGRLEQARDNVTVLLEQAPDRAAVRRAAGDLALASRDPAAAADQFREALALEASSGNLLRLFQARVAMGEVDAGVDLLEEWAARHPDDVEVRRAIAEAYLARGRLAEARERYEQALAIAPDDPGLLNNMAFVLDALDDPSALDFAQRALARSPEDPAMLDTLGWMLVRRGEPERGLGYLRDAHSRASGNPAIRYHIAAALAALDRKAEAQRELKVALQAQRPFEGIADARALMEQLSQ